MEVGDRDEKGFFIIKKLSMEEIIAFCEENDLEALIPESEDDVAGWTHLCEKINDAYTDNMGF